MKEQTQSGRNTGSKQQQDIIQSQWKQIQGQVRNRWQDLTDADVQRAEGSHDYLVSKLRERCNFSFDKAQREVEAFERELGNAQDNQSQR